MYLVPTTATVNVDQNTRNALDSVHVKYCATDMQENMWARLRDSRPGGCLIHATKPTYFPAFLYIFLYLFLIRLTKHFLQPQPMMRKWRDFSPLRRANGNEASPGHQKIKICESIIKQNWLIGIGNLHEQSWLNRVQMVQFECPRHWKTGATLRLWEILFPIFSLPLSGVIRIGLPG